MFRKRQLFDREMDGMRLVLEALAQFLVMIMPTVGYVDTIRLMVRSKSTSAYNFKTIMLINIAQGAKVLYFFWHPYSITVFGQSVSLLVVATVLTLLKFHYSHKESLPASVCSRVIDIRKNICFRDYVLSLTLYSTVSYGVLVVGRYFLREVAVESLGLFSNVMEAATSFPMFLRVVVRKNVKNVSVVLIVQYLAGDILKYILYVIAKAPWSFFFGAFCQFAVDLVTSITFFVNYCRAKEQDEGELLDTDEKESSA